MGTDRTFAGSVNCAWPPRKSYGTTITGLICATRAEYRDGALATVPQISGGSLTSTGAKVRDGRPDLHVSVQNGNTGDRRQRQSRKDRSGDTIVVA
jgi:hypothetical protein